MNEDRGYYRRHTNGLIARNIVRRFGAISALCGVDLDISRGEVHALVGENGAGKSTLARILAGSLRPHGGELWLLGQPYRPRSRREGITAGVAYVPQELSLVRGLTLAQNFRLGQPAGPFRFSPDEACRELAALARQYQLRVRPQCLVEDLPMAERQQAEILMAVGWGAKFLLLDEPSSSLGPREIDALLALCRRLRDEGVGILYISHKLREISYVADRLTVLRQGMMVAKGVAVRRVDMRDVAALMVGDLPVQPIRRSGSTVGGVRLRAEDLHVTAMHGPGLRGVSVEVRAGEIIGVVGVAGNGQEELARVLTGLTSPDRGRVVVDGRIVTGSPRAALNARVAYIPGNPSDGLAMELTVADNVTAKRAGDAGLAVKGFRRPSRVREFARHLLHLFEVRPINPDLLATGLSGGNRQKLLAARELSTTPAVLVAESPTKGLDPMAASVMRDRILDVAAKGGAVVLISADMEEVLDLAHTIAVLSGGVITDMFPVAEASPARLGAAMAGLSPGSVW